MMRFAFLLFFLLCCLTAKTCFSTCCKNEITTDDVNWDIMEDEEEKGHCSCQYGQYKREGTLYEFFEPIRILETVKDPGCMMTKGEEDTKLSALLQYGTGNETGNSDPPKVFQQVHIVLPDYLQDSIIQNDIRCWHISVGRTDDFLSEGDTAWNSDVVAAVEFPENEVFAVVSAILVCPFDAAFSQLGFPIDLLPWCLGAWGNTYPISGSVGTDDYITANAATAARAVLLGGRQGWIFDTATYYCYTFPMIIFIKSYFKFQPVRPTHRDNLVTMGLSALLWEEGLNASECNDNLAWVLWRKRSCCDSSNGSTTDTDTGSTVDMGSGDANLTQDFLDDKVDLDAIGDILGTVGGYVNVIIGGVLVSIFKNADGSFSGVADLANSSVWMGEMSSGSYYGKANLSGDWDLVSGFVNQSGNVDLSILGDLNVSSGEGQGFMGEGNKGEDFGDIGVDDIPVMDKIPGLDGIDTSFFDDLIKN